MDPIKIRVWVSAETNRRINRGDPVGLTIPDREDVVVGNVYQKATVANPATRTFAITVICRNFKVNDSEDAKVLALDLPRVTDLLPATRVEIGGGGPLYVEERKTLKQDEDGYNVWIAEGINLTELSRDLSGAITIRKQRVVPGPTRVPYQGIFLARELTDSGSLQLGQACVVGVPEDAKDGATSLAATRILAAAALEPCGRQIPTRRRRRGFLCSCAGHQSKRFGRGQVFVVQDQLEGRGAVARKVEVGLFESVGQLQRIAADDAQGIAEGMKLIVQGANYLRDGDPVSVMRVDRGSL